MKTFIESQFNYCPRSWMFHSRTTNNKINRLYERALRIVYSDFKSSFEGLVMKDNSFSIHERNIQSLAIEIYKFLNGLSPSFLNNVFHKNISNSYDLRNHKELYSRNPKTDRYGTETVSYIARKIWSKVPETEVLEFLPKSYPGVYALNCSSNAEYIRETKKNVMNRTTEHQQGTINGK